MKTCEEKVKIKDCIKIIQALKDTSSREQPITFEQVLNLFTKALREDKELYERHEYYIAKAFYDAVLNAGIKFPQLYELANVAAKNFLDSLMKGREE